MTRAGVAYYEREQRDLVRLNYVEPPRSPLSAASGEALGHVGYFAELIDEWAPEAHADERLYRLGLVGRGRASRDGAPVEPLARYFEYWLLRLQGVYPSFACAACGGSLERRARRCRRAITCWSAARARPAGGRAVGGGAEVPGARRRSRRSDWTARAAARRRGSSKTAHRRLISVHLEKDLKSARVLREMRQAVA